jgi:ABC-2 type transport system permease protein
MVLAVTIGVLLGIAMGLCVFWVGQVTPLQIVVQKLSFLFGGLMAPVTLYPDWLAHVAQATPFAAQRYWPATMVTSPSPALFAQVLGWQILWIALLSLLVAWIWSRGVARVLREGV